MKEKAIIYTRISTAKQDATSQIDQLKKYAAYKNYDVVAIYEDVITGSKKASDRKAFSKLEEYIDEHKIQHILIWELSRLGRSLENIITTVNKLTQQSINVYIHNNQLNTLDENKQINPNTQLVLNLMGSVSEFEKSLINARVYRGFKIALENNHFHGTIYGYESKNKLYKTVPDEVKTIKKIYEMFLNGNSSPTIAKHLNLKNIKTKRGKQWSDVQIREILHNETYTGIRKYKNGIDVKTPKIITKANYKKAQQLFKNNSNLNQDKAIFTNYLKGKIICGVCGLPYFQHARKNKNDFHYKCMSNRKVTIGQLTERCSNNSIHINWLNSMAHFALGYDSGQLIEKKQAQLMTAKLTLQINKSIKQTKQNIKIKEREIITNKNKLKKALEMALNETITNAQYVLTSTDLKFKIDDLDNELEQLHTDLYNKEKSKKDIKLLLLNDKQNIKENIQLYVNAITITPTTINDIDELKLSIPEKHHHRTISKIIIETKFNTHTFYSVVGFGHKYSFFKGAYNTLLPIHLAESITQ